MGYSKYICHSLCYPMFKGSSSKMEPTLAYAIHGTKLVSVPFNTSSWSCKVNVWSRHWACIQMPLIFVVENKTEYYITSFEQICILMLIWLYQGIITLNDSNVFILR